MAAPGAAVEQSIAATGDEDNEAPLALTKSDVQVRKVAASALLLVQRCFSTACHEEGLVTRVLMRYARYFLGTANANRGLCTHASGRGSAGARQRGQHPSSSSSASRDSSSSTCSEAGPKQVYWRCCSSSATKLQGREGCGSHGMEGR